MSVEIEPSDRRPNRDHVIEPDERKNVVIQRRSSDGKLYKSIGIDKDTGSIEIFDKDGKPFLRFDAEKKFMDINKLKLGSDNFLTTRDDGQLLINNNLFEGKQGSIGPTPKVEKVDGGVKIKGDGEATVFHGSTGPTPDIESSSDGVKIKGGNRELVVKHGKKGATGPAPIIQRFSNINGKSGVTLTGEGKTEYLYDGNDVSETVLKKYNNDLDKSLRLGKPTFQYLERKNLYINQTFASPYRSVSAVQGNEKENVVIFVNLKNLKVNSYKGHTGYILELWCKNVNTPADESKVDEVVITQFAPWDENIFSNSHVFHDTTKLARNYYVKLSVHDKDRYTIKLDKFHFSVYRI